VRTPIGAPREFASLPGGVRPPNLCDVSKTAGVRIKALSAGLTDVGRKRSHNEDSYLIDDELQLFVVADGMGGHAGGCTASRIAVETIDKELRAVRNGGVNPFKAQATLQDSPLPDFLRTAVEKACFEIYRAAQEDPRLAGMGTTVITLCVQHEHALFAHVGDSRAYLVRGDLIQQISEDHSLVNEQIKAGMITPDEARHSRYKNIITRSVGFEEEVQVDVMGIVVQQGDSFILCSDGLANLVEDFEIRDAITSSDLKDAPKKLIDLANERGGDDNITVIVVRIAQE
jgi:PPM family protein phosphatase